MNSILKQQQLLQAHMEELGKTYIPKQDRDDVRSATEYIRQMKDFFSIEANELMVAIGRNNPDVLKPWKEGHATLATSPLQTNAATREEAIDCLCFCMNMLLVAGITPENIEEEYTKVRDKIVRRLHEHY